MDNPVWLGTEYGGKAVHLELLGPDSLVFSFGIGEDISWDLELIKKVDCRILGFDPTPKAKEFIKSKNLDEWPMCKLWFFPVGVFDYDGTAHFDPPQNPNWASYSIKENGEVSFRVKTLTTLMLELGHELDTIDVLKLDIEGAEHRVLKDVFASRIFPKQILVEIHGPKDNLKDLILTNGYDLTFTNGEEFTFLRKS